MSSLKHKGCAAPGEAATPRMFPVCFKKNRVRSRPLRAGLYLTLQQVEGDLAFAPAAKSEMTFSRDTASRCFPGNGRVVDLASRPTSRSIVHDKAARRLVEPRLHVQCSSKKSATKDCADLESRNTVR